MSYLPTICDSCARVALAPFTSVAHAVPACGYCGGARRVVPSCSYVERDVELFEELSGAVGEGLGPFDAQRLGIEVSRALWSGNVGEIFNTLGARWVSLVPLVLVTGKNEGQQRRILLMLKTIFEAVALTRRSGTIRAVRLSSDADSVPPSQHGAGRR